MDSEEFKYYTIECFPPALLALDREHEPPGIDLKTFKTRLMNHRGD